MADNELIFVQISLNLFLFSGKILILFWQLQGIPALA
jgi:hypothetical protein